MKNIPTQEKDQKQLNAVVEIVLDLAKQKGAVEAEVNVSKEDGFGINVRQGKLETLEYHSDKTVGIGLFFGHCMGSVITTDASEAALKNAVEKACHIAKFTQKDSCLGLAEKELMAEEVVDLDLYHPWNISTDEAISQALDGEKFALELDKRIVNSDGVSISTINRSAVYANSHGFSGSASTSAHSVSGTFIARENDKMERDYDYAISRDASKLLSIREVVRSGVNLTTRRLGARTIKTQKVPVIFDAVVASGLISNFTAAISGNNIFRNTSFLIDHVGKKIFPEFINIYERPYLKGDMGSAAFDAEGVATRNQHFIKNGILQTYILGSYSARKLGLKTTANAGGTHNLRIDNSDLSLQQLFKKMHTGLYVVELIGQGINIVTGDYSRGVFGFWVKNGEIQFPVSQITIAGNLKEMFKNIVAIGNDIDKRGNIQTGSILLAEMTVAGN